MATILVVDDEAINAMYLAANLADEGHTVHTAINAQEALQFASQSGPDVLISDWKLGGAVDGVELARQLLTANPSLSVILYSGLPADELRKMLNGIHVTAVLQKPCAVEEMLALINH